MHGQSVYPFSDQFGANTIPFGAAHTFITYIKDYTPDGVGIIWSQMQASQHLDNCRKSPTRQQTNAPKFIKRKTCCMHIYTFLAKMTKRSLKMTLLQFISIKFAFERIRNIEHSYILKNSSFSIAPAEASLYHREAGEMKKESARGTMGRGKEKARFSLFPSSPARFLFFESCYFYRDTQREPLRRREVHSLLQKL